MAQGHSKGEGLTGGCAPTAKLMKQRAHFLYGHCMCNPLDSGLGQGGGPPKYSPGFTEPLSLIEGGMVCWVGQGLCRFTVWVNFKAQIYSALSYHHVEIHNTYLNWHILGVLASLAKKRDLLHWEHVLALYAEFAVILCTMHLQFELKLVTRQFTQAQNIHTCVHSQLVHSCIILV